ncbi:hypothetical protein [Acaryochloris sp. IP29b_bin.148]|uniref:hypothetical protein n=1 Tax=Acaryochloris sp. IP29b_bin.148 TaxID=2969218 RepID=UPI00263547B9|nr:hypothetical protein [Acaryochloris sp. IP29b_bin.148]
MGVSFKHWSGGIALATLVLAANGIAVAQEQDVDLQNRPLRQSTISETLDQQTNLDSHWTDTNVGGDANFAFSFDQPEGVIRDASERIEVIYKDLLQQQDDDFPTMRTRDLANPYSTSLLELQSSSGIGNSEIDPAPQYIPPAAPAVPALW